MTDTNTVPQKSRRESGHWYDMNAALVEKVPAKTQKKNEPTKFVDVTLRQARELDLAPGQSTIRNVRSKHQLNVWREKQVLMAALTLPRLAGESDEAFCDRVLEDSHEVSRSTAARGTEIHQTIDAFVGTQDWSDPWVAAVGGLLETFAPRDQWQTEQTVVHRYGYGTTADLFLRPSKQVQYGVVLDIKTKDVKAGKQISDEDLWDDHLQQLAATREALGMPHAACGIVFVDRAAPKASLVLANHQQLHDGWNMFLAALYLWQIDNGYRPTWAAAPLSRNA